MKFVHTVSAVALVGSLACGCDPVGEDGGGDGGLMTDGGAGGGPGGEAFGALAGSWDVTFDDGTFDRIRAELGAGPDGRSLVIHSERDTSRARWDSFGSGPAACVGARDALYLRLTDDGARVYGHIVTTYPCGTLRPAEVVDDALGWPDDRFDETHDRGSAAVIGWREGEAAADGTYGAVQGRWTIEGGGLICSLQLNAAGGFVGGCDDGLSFRDAPAVFNGVGLLDGATVSGSIDDEADFAGQRVGPAVDDAAPAGDDPLAGASGRWAVWGHDHGRFRDGASLEISTEGPRVTATLVRPDVSRLDVCGVDAVPYVEEIIEVELEAEADGPAGTAVMRLEGACESGDRPLVASRTFTLVRDEAAPAAVPLLGGAWTLVPDDRGDPVHIELRGEALTVTVEDGDRFEGDIAPRLVTGVSEPRRPPLRYGLDWLSGRRVDP